MTTLITIDPPVMGPLLQVLKSAIREAKLLRELGSHPHIVTLHHSLRSESRRWVRPLDKPALHLPCKGSKVFLHISWSW